MGYRASKQASTKQSPYFMLYQKHMRLPIDAEMMPNSEQEEEIYHDAVIRILLDSREKAFKKAETNIAKAQKQQKETYDRKHLQSELAEGSEVLLENTAQKLRKGGKLDDAWLGPYMIHRHMGKGIYQLVNEKGKIMKKKANINRLKPFKRRLPQCDPDSSTQLPEQAKMEEPDVSSSDDESEEETPAISTNNPQEPDSATQPRKKRAKVEEPDTIIELITSSNDESEDIPAMQMGHLGSDMGCITNGEWLNDVVIHAAQQLLKNNKDLLPVGGLQNPILGQRLAFEVQMEEFVQILHSGGNHWITISTIGMEHAHVRVYDSLLGTLPGDAKKQITSLLMTEEKGITIEYANNQVSK